MKILTFSLVTLALLVAPTGRAQFVPGPNPIAGTVTAAQTLPSGAGVVSSTGNLEVSGSSNAITVTGTSSIQNDGVINQTGTVRAIRDNTGALTLTVTNNANALLQAADANAGATLNIVGIILGRLPLGTTFTVINNTAATPIAGTFANLHDGSIVTVFGNHLQASYEGGDGNDLTLTVVR